MIFKSRKERIEDLNLRLELVRQSIGQEKSMLEHNLASSAGKPENLPLVFLLGCASGWLVRNESLSSLLGTLATNDVPWKELLSRYLARNPGGSGKLAEQELMLRILNATQQDEFGN